VIEIRGQTLLKVNQITPTDAVAALLTSYRNHETHLKICDLVKQGFTLALWAFSHHSWMQLLSTMDFTLMVSLWEPRGCVSLKSF